MATMTNTEPMADARNQRGSRRKMTIGDWLLTSNMLFFVLSAASLVAAISVFLLTRAEDREKDRELERYKAKAQIEIGQAKADAAHALERAAELEKSAADARQETARLELQIVQIRSPRRIPDDHIAAFAVALAPFPGTILTPRWILRDSESQGLAEQVTRIAVEKGWVHQPLDLGPEDGMSEPSLNDGFSLRYSNTEGIHVLTHQPEGQIREAGAALARALEAAGLSADYYNMGETTPPDVAVHLIIGRRIITVRN